MFKKALSLGCLLLAAPGVRWSTAMAQELMVVRGQVRGADGSSSLKASVLRVEGARDVRVIATETAADGTYSFQTAAATLVVVAKADGYISEEKTWARVGPQVSQPLNFLLDPAAAVTGRVTTSQGSGVQGAKVTIRYLTAAVRSLLFNVELGEVPTDNFGYFSLPMAAAGRPFVLDITSEEYPFTSSGVCSALQGKPSLCSVQVTGRSQVVRGTVMDRYGKPAPGVLVRLRASADRESLSADQRASIALARSANKSVRSQSDGAFSFAGVPLGNFTIIAGEAPLVTSARNQLSTSGETASVILRLP